MGAVDEEVIGLAEELDAGLIVMGSSGLGAMRRTLMGSVSDSVVRRAHSPVLIVREGNARDPGSPENQGGT
jgi:nucleotide-binding universal stress UspA family protein